MKFVYQLAKSSVYCSSFEPIDSRMYVIHKQDHALIIDPFVENELHTFLQHHLIDQVQVILTHEHYDHISGVNWLREFTNCSVLCSASCAERIQDSRKNLSQYFTALFSLQDQAVRNEVIEMDVQLYSCEADQTFTGELEFTWFGHHVYVRETPGHSIGSVCVVVDNHIIFTGDSLINGKPVVTRLPGGNRQAYESVTQPYLYGLPNNMLVFPGHGDTDTIDNLLQRS